MELIIAIVVVAVVAAYFVLKNSKGSKQETPDAAPYKVETAIAETPVPVVIETAPVVEVAPVVEAAPAKKARKPRVPKAPVKAAKPTKKS